MKNLEQDKGENRLKSRDIIVKLLTFSNQFIQLLKNKLMRLLLCILTASILFACNSNKDKITVKDDEGNKTTIDVKDMANKGEEMKNKMEELQKLNPLSIDELKALMPKELMGAPQSNLDAVSMAGIAHTVSADYETNDTTKIKVSIFDCAGTIGAAYYNMQYFGLMNFEQDNEREYTKSIEFNGGRAIINCRKDRNDCTFTYFTGERYLVVLNGDNVGIDQLKQVAGNLHIK